MSGTRRLPAAAAAPVALLVLLAGAVTALAAGLLHDSWWGLAWGWAAGIAAVLALPPSWWGRFAFVGGWLLLMVVLLRGRPEGDFIVPSTLEGYLYLASGLVLVLVAALSSAGARRSRRDVPS